MCTIFHSCRVNVAKLFNRYCDGAIVRNGDFACQCFCNCIFTIITCEKCTNNATCEQCTNHELSCACVCSCTASLFVESGYSRLPVYNDTIDNIIGVIHEKDFYTARYRGETMICNLKSPVIYTTAGTKISELLRVLQTRKAHMAVVVDEYGGTVGIVTLEDILEELVGEIWDEHDEVIEMFQKQEDGSFLIACSANLDDMYDLFEVKGECEAATVSGWVLEQVGRVPEEGDHFQAEGLDVKVTKVEHRRVLEIRVEVLPEETEEEK